MAATESAPTKELSELKIGEQSNGDAKPPANGTPSNGTEACPSPTPAAGSCTLKETFKAFSKFGDTKSDGKLITLSQSDKWMKQAKVIDGKKITTTDTGIHFKKLKSLKVGFDDYNKYLEDLAKTKKIEVGDIKNKLATCGPPGHTGVGVVKSPAAIERLTDTTKYTGSHKQRFDETGKGKGIAGRKDVQDTSGYVSGYQHKNTYDKTH